MHVNMAAVHLHIDGQASKSHAHSAEQVDMHVPELFDGIMMPSQSAALH